MENIRRFYNELRSFAKSDAARAIKQFGTIEVFEEYPSLGYFNTNRILEFRDNIANKALILGEEVRKSYAGLIITELDSYYYSLLKDCETREGKISLPSNCEATIEDEPINLGFKVDYERAYQLIEINGQYFDFSSIIYCWEDFAYKIMELFAEFKISLSEIINGKDFLECKSELIILFSQDRDTIHDNVFQGKKNEFTIQRKKQAIMLMLEELGVRAGAGGSIPMAEAQRFVYFLVGHGTREDVINNTSIATAFKNDRRSDRTIKEDCEFVASYFDRLGLTELAIKAKNDK